jgi:phosphoribosylformimino-5-aminoimidazole carboxamide ribotide isomerase
VEVIPAIDIRGGKCVNLFQGDFAQETVFSESPVDVASHWANLGAPRLHVVDLDGARAGAPVSSRIIAEIAASVSIPVQMGGGIRTLESARMALSAGVSRVVFGTAAVEEPGLISDACRELGAEAVVVSVDGRGGYVAVRGWTAKTGMPVAGVAMDMESRGVRRLVYTDVARTGTLTEPNFDSIESLCRDTTLKMVVAGGIARVGHLRRLAELGVEAAIVGKAAYTGDIDVREAIAAAGAESGKTN